MSSIRSTSFPSSKASPNNNAGMFACYYPECCKTYPTKYNLHRHISVSHLMIRSFECADCQSRFTCKQNLRDHQLIHMGLKPFPCPICHKSFRQISQLRAHYHVHKEKQVTSWTESLELPPLTPERQQNCTLPGLP